MSEQPDAELLRNYAGARSEPAFRELVRRHVHFVHSTAVRVVRDSHLAEDVTQEVFVELARQATRLTSHPMLAAWLHRTTRNIASQSVRTAVRRRKREQQHVTLHEQGLTSPEPSWEEISPSLDLLIDDLNTADRAAIIYRYFQHKTAREMAEILGISTESAQKRVSRAVEQLRGKLAQRGITVSTGGLAAMISSNALQAAPAGVVATVCATATTTFISLTQTLTMTALQKTLIASTVLVLTGATLYQTRQVHHLRGQVHAFQQQGDLPIQLDVPSPPSRTVREARPPKDPAKSAMSAWLDRVDLLKTRLELTAGAKIPEMQWLTEQNWLDAARNELKSDDDYRRAMSQLRSTAELKFTSIAQPALQKYLQENTNTFPSQIEHLQAYFDTPVDPAVLQRWHAVPASEFPFLKLGGDHLITPRTVVDQAFDQRVALGSNGYGTSSPGGANQAALESLVKAYAASHSGNFPAHIGELLPYVTTPEQQAELDRIMKAHPPAGPTGPPP